MAKLLIGASVGAADPTRASLAFHIAANGAAPNGTECDLVLMGDATELAKPGATDSVRGVGIPPLADLWAACLERGIKFFI